jgi:hypothetical protein
VPIPAPHPGLSQKSAEPGGGIAQSAPVLHGSPTPPELPLPVLALALTLLLDALALLLDALAPPPDPPAPLLLDALAPPPDPPTPLLLLDAAPPLPDADVEPDDESSLLDEVVVPVGEGLLCPHPEASAAPPARTETRATHGAKKDTRGMVAIVPPPPDPPART